MKKDWTLIRKIKGGHGYWRHKNGEIGIADNSGTYPEDCEPADKPPLLLDRSRPIVLSDGMLSVPIKHLDGNTSHTPATGFEALWVATQFHMEIAAYEKGCVLPLRVAVIDAIQMTDALTKQNIGSLRQAWLAESAKGLLP